MEDNKPKSLENSSQAGDRADDSAKPGQSAAVSHDDDEILIAELVEDGPQRKTRLRLLAYIAVALITISIVGEVAINRDRILRWYYVQKLHRRNLQFSGPAFLDAVSAGNEEAVDLFIKAGIPTDVKNDKAQTAVIIASEKGYANIVTALAARNRSVLQQADSTGATPLIIAARRGNETMVKTLMDNGADVNFIVPDSEGPANAIQAVLDVAEFKDEHMKILAYLMGKGADIRSRNASGRFPLLFAAERGWTMAAKLLIEKGADVNETDPGGNSPLMTAACRKHWELVQLLVAKGARINIAAPNGFTPLMCASRSGDPTILKVLLANGASINAKTTKGSTALIEAAAAGNYEAVKILLNHGADPGASSVPAWLTTLHGKSITVKGKKNKLGEVLTVMARAAAQDGYAIIPDQTLKQSTIAGVKGPWNKTLIEVARKNNLFLVAKNKNIHVMPYDPAAVRHGRN